MGKANKDYDAQCSESSSHGPWSGGGGGGVDLVSFRLLPIPVGGAKEPGSGFLNNKKGAKEPSSVSSVWLSDRCRVCRVRFV